MKKWKPSSTGFLFCGGSGTARTLWMSEGVPLIRDGISGEPPPGDFSTWSLLQPDMQPGAPTVAQLERWQWWAFEHDHRFLYCGVVRHAKGLMSVGAALLNPEFVTHSAPIQEDLSRGTLWVPLEVANADEHR